MTGDHCTWLKEDADIPAGSIGVVVDFKECSSIGADGEELTAADEPPEVFPEEEDDEVPGALEALRKAPVPKGQGADRIEESRNPDDPPQKKGRPLVQLLFSHSSKPVTLPAEELKLEFSNADDTPIQRLKHIIVTFANVCNGCHLLPSSSHFCRCFNDACIGVS